MLRHQTTEIILAVNKAIYRYDEECKLIPAGENGKARKKRLEALLEENALASPAEIFIALYQFCVSDEKLSRLLNNLQNTLIILAGIETQSFLYQFNSGNVSELKLKAFAEKLGFQPARQYSIN